MIVQPDMTTTAAAENVPNPMRSVARGTLVRWLLSNGAFSVPQAAGPIVFALLAIPITGDPNSGDAIVLAIIPASAAIVRIDYSVSIGLRRPRRLFSLT